MSFIKEVESLLKNELTKKEMEELLESLDPITEDIAKYVLQEIKKDPKIFAETFKEHKTNKLSYVDIIHIETVYNQDYQEKFKNSLKKIIKNINYRT